MFAFCFHPHSHTNESLASIFHLKTNIYVRDFKVFYTKLYNKNCKHILLCHIHHSVVLKKATFMHIIFKKHLKYSWNSSKINCSANFHWSNSPGIVFFPRLQIY